MRIAEYRESSDLLTQMALRGYPLSMFASVCLLTHFILMRLKFFEVSLVKYERVPEHRPTKRSLCYLTSR